MQEIKITEADAGQRLNKFLNRYLDNAPSSFVYKMLRKRNIKINNNKAAGNEILCAGDTVQIYMADKTIASFRRDGTVPVQKDGQLANDRANHTSLREAGDASLVIDYEKSLSGRHCQVSERNGKFYVKDLQSSNGTLLNGVRILAEMELCSGSILTLGRLEMKVEIKCE